MRVARFGFGKTMKAFVVIAVVGLTVDCGAAPRCEHGVATQHGMPEFHSRRNEDGSWGFAVTEAGLASVEQPRPMQVEVWDQANGEIRTHGAGYATLTQAERGWNGSGRLTLGGGVAVEFQDRWEFQDEILHVERVVRVHGNSPGGFLSAATLLLEQVGAWPDVQWFAPGMIYGGFEHLSPAAIGGREHYRPGAFAVRIREDRLPAPLLAGRFADGTTLAVLNPAPCGDTTAADGDSVQGGAMTDERFRFGAIGAEEQGCSLSLGYWFPGSEGEVTYAGNTYPGGQLHQ